MKTENNSKKQIQSYKYDVDRHNYHALIAISMIGSTVSIVLLVLSLPSIGILKLMPAYALMALFAVATYVIAKTVLKNHKHLALLFYYMMMITTMLLAIYMGTVMGRDTNATTFILLMLLLPMFVIDYPWRLITSNVILSALFCLAAARYKTGVLMSLDISNTVVVCSVSAVFIVITVRRNLNNFKHLKDEKDKAIEKDMLINAIPVGVAIYEVRGNQSKQVFTNDEFYRLFEDTREARAKRTAGNFLESIHPEDRQDLLKAMKSVIDGEDHIVSVCRSIKGDGSYLWVRFASSVAKREGDYIEVYSTYSSMEEEIRNKQASEAKTAFLSRVSHDIRTPMNAIIGMTKIGKQEKDINKMQECFDYIDRSSEFLLGLINDILDLSKIESGEFTLNPEPYSLEEFNAGVHGIIGPLIKKKNIKFIYQMEDVPKCIIIDRLRFNQIFFNLLSNAVKYTNKGGTIEFTARTISPKDGLQGIRFTVKDNGIGISKENQEKMFTPFSHNAYNAYGQQTGSGLGLPIVKSIVDAMSGRIEICSRVNEGTEIIVDLFAETVDEGYKTESKAVQDVSLEGTRVLIAEDNEVNIIVAKRLLEKKGCSIVIVKDGEECVEAFANSPVGTYDAILMDVRMPKMDGIEATKKIREMNREDAEKIAIIAMTADAFTEEKKKTLDAGMDAHLTKPVVPGKLYEALISNINRQ